MESKNKSDEPILVWSFKNAPNEFRNLSENGGDEDWVAVIPPNSVNKYISWMDEGTPFGCCNVEYYKHPNKNGYQVAIGSHS